MNKATNVAYPVFLNMKVVSILLSLLVLFAPLISNGQTPIPPPISTDLNSGIPSNWQIQTDGGIGWNWDPAVGYSGSGGLTMDCGTCVSPENTTLWSPWLDLSGQSSIDIHFKCAIIAGSFGIAPPFYINFHNLFLLNSYTVPRRGKERFTACHSPARTAAS